MLGALRCLVSSSVPGALSGLVSRSMLGAPRAQGPQTGTVSLWALWCWGEGNGSHALHPLGLGGLQLAEQ